MNKVLPKRYKLFETGSGLRLTIPLEVKWSNGDYVEMEQIDDDTLIIKRKKFT